MFDPLNSVAAVLQPEGEKVSGTAFFVEPRGLLLTCFHVVRDHAQKHINVRLRLPNGSADEVLVASIEPGQGAQDCDLTLLRVSPDSIPDRVEQLRLADRTTPVAGQQFRSYGFNFHFGNNGAPGSGVIVGRARVEGFKYDAWMVNSDTIDRGYSGGPAIDARYPWLVVGMIFKRFIADPGTPHRNTAYLIPADVIADVAGVVQTAPHPATDDLVRYCAERAIFHANRPMLPTRLKDGPPLDPSSSSIDLRRIWREKKERPNLILLIGDAGVGKTTFLDRLVGELWTSPRTLGFEHSVLAIFIPARALAVADLMSLSAFCSFLETSHSLPARIRGASDFESLLKAGSQKFCVCIDALDECPAKLRLALLRSITVMTHALQPYKHFVLLTSRPVTEIGAVFEPTEAHQWRLPAISLKRVWFGLQNPDDAVAYARAVRGDEAGEKLSKVFEEMQKFGEDRGAWMLLNPYFLNAVMRIEPARWSRDFLRSSIELMAELVATRIQEARCNSDGALAPVLAELGTCERALSVLALSESVDGDSSDGFTTQDNALQKLFEWNFVPKQRKRQSALERLKRAQLVLGACQSTRILTILWQHTAWEHLILRDYFAARQLADGTKISDVVDALLAVAANPSWRPFWQFSLLQMSSTRLEELIARLFGKSADPRLAMDADANQMEAVFRHFTHAIFVGLVIPPAVRQMFFESFSKAASHHEGYRGFASAARVYSEDFGIFQFLTAFQTVPEGVIALKRAQALIPEDAAAHQWGTVERWTTFTYKIYRGSMATLEPYCLKS